jgi:hypothetical protein
MSLFQILNTRPVAFNAEYSRICGKETKLNNGKTVFKDDQSCAILLSQLCYWHAAMKGQEFYKTDEELMAECGCFSRDKHLKNKKRLIEMDVISYNVKGTPARGYWQVKEKELISLLSPASSVVVEQPQLDVVTLPQLYITENTTDIYIATLLIKALRGMKEDKILKIQNIYKEVINESLEQLKEIEEALSGNLRTPQMPAAPLCPLGNELEEIFILYFEWFFTAKKANTRKPSTFSRNFKGLVACLQKLSKKGVIKLMSDAIDRNWQGIELYESYILKDKSQVIPSTSINTPSITVGVESPSQKDLDDMPLYGDISDLY